MISACVLIRSSHGEYEGVVKRIKQFKGVDRIFPVLGRYDVVVDLKADTFQSLGNTILKMGRMAGVVFTETLIEICQEEK